MVLFHPVVLTNVGTVIVFMSIQYLFCYRVLKRDFGLDTEMPKRHSSILQKGIESNEKVIVFPVLETFSTESSYRYRLGTVNSKTVNSIFNLIRTFNVLTCLFHRYLFPLFSYLFLILHSNCHLVRTKI